MYKQVRREADREWGVRNPGMEKLLTWEEFRENTYSFLNSAGMASNRLKDILFCHKISFVEMYAILSQFR